MENTVKAELTKEWDKTFPKSEKVTHRKVAFPNRYGITLAADLYEPKEAEKKTGCDCGMRAVWRGKGAGSRTVCADYGGAWLPHHCL